MFPGSTGGSLIGDTRFKLERESTLAAPVARFVITEELLNEALFNITMSAAFQFGTWTTSADTVITTSYNIYSFASPHQFLIPYILCLILSLPFLFLGISSLRYNGVSAMQSGYLQILMTTTGSQTLEKAIAGGYIRG